MGGFASDMEVLGPRRSMDPQRDASIAMMVDGEHREYPAVHAVVRHAVPGAFLGLGKSETDFPHRLLDVLAHGYRQSNPDDARSMLIRSKTDSQASASLPSATFSASPPFA